MTLPPFDLPHQGDRVTDTTSNFKTNFSEEKSLSACIKAYGGYKTNWMMTDALMNLE